MSRATCVVILAAGEGTRMRSSRPKPLHHLCGRPMALFVLDAATLPEVRRTVVVVGHDGTWVEKELSASASVPLTFVEQREQLGTGHAAFVALSAIDEAIGVTDGDVVILPGDTPLLRRATIEALLRAHRDSDATLTVMSAHVDEPTGYGRMVRARDGSLERIVEERDATSEERAIDEINTSIMVVRQSVLGPALRRIGRNNAQNEYYLTDLVSVLHEMGHRTNAFVLHDAAEAAGVNDRLQLAGAERVLRQRINEQWLRRGVTMWDPLATYIDADVEIAADVSLLPGTILKGRCRIASGAQIGPNALLTDVEVGENASVGTIEATNVRIGADARVGSFLVLKPGTEVASGQIVDAPTT